MILLTKLVPSNYPFKRAGVIFYYFDSLDQLKFILAVDKKYGELTDFGGGIKQGESFIDAAIRETEEESYGIFNLKNKKKEFIESSISMYDKETVIIFSRIYVPNEYILMNAYYDKFVEKRKSNKYTENNFIFPICVDDLYKLLNTNNSKVTKFYNTSNVPLSWGLTVMTRMYYGINTGVYPVLYDKIKIIINNNYNDIHRLIIARK